MIRLRLLGLSAGILLSTHAAHALRFVAYGDARTYPAMHQQVVDGISKVDPELVIFTGDLWDGYGLTTAASQSKFGAILRKHANIGALLDQNRFLVARGNHESEADLLSFRPSLVRDGAAVYSFAQGNCFFVCLGMDPEASLGFLERELQSKASTQAAWRFVYSHYPAYSTGDHGAQGSPGLEKLCDKYAVTAVFNGHDHIYERTHQIFAGKVADTGNGLLAGKGTVYIVSGGGGAPLYRAGRQWWTHASASANHFCDVQAGDSLVTVTATLPNGGILDVFTIGKMIGKARPPLAVKRPDAE